MHESRIILIHKDKEISVISDSWTTKYVNNKTIGEPDPR